MKGNTMDDDEKNFLTAKFFLKMGWVMPFYVPEYGRKMRSIHTHETGPDRLVELCEILTNRIVDVPFQKRYVGEWRVTIFSRLVGRYMMSEVEEIHSSDERVCKRWKQQMKEFIHLQSVALQKKTSINEIIIDEIANTRLENKGILLRENYQYVESIPEIVTITVALAIASDETVNKGLMPYLCGRLPSVPSIFGVNTTLKPTVTSVSTQTDMALPDAITLLSDALSNTKILEFQKLFN